MTNLASAYPKVLKLEQDQTLRWSGRKNQCVLWVAPKSFLNAAQPDSWTIPNFWKLQNGDFITITNRCCDLPTWFILHPSEVGGPAIQEMQKLPYGGHQLAEPLQGANIWRVRAGERLVWLNEQDESQPVIEILECRSNALVLGENAKLTSLTFAEFGIPEKEEQNQTAMRNSRAAFQLAVSLGLPRAFSEEWKFGI